MGIADFLVDIKRKKSFKSWAGHLMCRSDYWWTIRATEWMPREGKQSTVELGSKLGGGDEMRKFACARWDRLAQYRGIWRSMGGAFVLQWT